MPLALLYEVENRAVFWSFAPRYYLIFFLIIFYGIGIGINRLIIKLKLKKDMRTQSPGISRLPGAIRPLAMILLLGLIASQFIDLWHEPGEFWMAFGIAAGIGIFLLATQYLRPPDWLYRNLRLFLITLFLILTLGLGGLGISLGTPNLARYTGWILPFVLILAVYFLVVLFVQNRKWKQLKSLIPARMNKPGPSAPKPDWSNR